MSPDTHPQVRPDVETHILPDGSSLLFDPAEGDGHVLNQLGALAWDYCDGALSCAQIAREIADLIPQVADVHDAILELLGEFAERGLLLAPEGVASVK